jgi:RecB family endonuclease NucS
MQTSENVALNFKSETALEEFVWENLWELLSLTPIARQYYIEGQLCDILATDLNKQLVVIELKNTALVNGEMN